jgi:hypothetical protein
MNNEHYPKQTQSNPIPPYIQRAWGCGGDEGEKNIFFPKSRSYHDRIAADFLYTCASIDRRSCGALMGGPAPISESGAGIPTRGSLGRRLARRPGAGSQNRCGGFSN